MDLATYSQMPKEERTKGGSFLKFTPSENVKIIRFLYATASEISVRNKLFDTATKKTIFDTPDGNPTMSLRVAVYTSKTEFATMIWDRRADTFGCDVLMPLWESAGGRICDQVYKVTCAKAGTLEAQFTFFPLKDSETYAMPSLTEPPATQTAPATAQPAQATYQAPAQQPAQTQPVQQQPVAQQQQAPAPTASKKKNFWEE